MKYFIGLLGGDVRVFFSILEFYLVMENNLVKLECVKFFWDVKNINLNKMKLVVFIFNVVNFIRKICFDKCLLLLIIISFYWFCFLL